MSEIVERLHKTPLYYGSGEASALGEQAADEITALRAENERLRAALKEIESITVHSGGDIHGISAFAWQAAFNHAHIVARAALGGE